MKKMKKLFKRLTVFDWLIIFVLLAGFVFLSSFVFKEEKWLKVEVKVGPEQWWWDSKPSPYWLADSIKAGDAQFDGLGRKIAEVLETEIYEWGGTRKDVYLSLDLKVGYDKKRKIYRFNQQTVGIGKPLSLGMGRIGFQGLVVSAEGMKADKKETVKIVEAELMSVYPWIAEAITIGTQMKDNQGKLKAEVLDKRVELADITVTTDRGEVLARKDPLKRDVLLTLKLVVEESFGLYYFREGQVVKIGNLLWIKFPQVDVNEASITKVLD